MYKVKSKLAVIDFRFWCKKTSCNGGTKSCCGVVSVWAHWSSREATHHNIVTPTHVAGMHGFYIFKNVVCVQYLGWLAKLGGRGGSNIGTSSEVWRAAVFPFAILQILVNLTNYEISKRAYIIDQQYKDNMTHEWFPAATWVPFVNSTNWTTR